MRKLFLTSRFTATLAITGILAIIVAIVQWKEVADAIFHMTIQPWGDLSVSESITLIRYYSTFSLVCLSLGVLILPYAIYRSRRGRHLSS